MADRTEAEFVGGSLDGFITDTQSDIVAMVTVRQVGEDLFTELAMRRGAGVTRDAVEGALFGLLLAGGE
mgnify:FL=1